VFYPPKLTEEGSSLLGARKLAHRVNLLFRSSLFNGAGAPLKREDLKSYQLEFYFGSVVTFAIIEGVLP
jgi:hypothetical protein